MSASYDIDTLVKLLKAYKIRYANESDIQRGIATILDKHSLKHTREHQLDSGSRLDFLTSDGVAIEVKVDGSNANVIRQLHRYAGFKEVTGVVLFTTRSRHTQNLPDTMQGKPVRAVVLSPF